MYSPKYSKHVQQVYVYRFLSNLAVFYFAVFLEKLPFFSFAVFFAVSEKNGKFFICRFFWQKRLKNYLWGGVRAQ